MGAKQTEDVFVEVFSRIGNRIVCPSKWTIEENEVDGVDRFTTSDGYMALHILTGQGDDFLAWRDGCVGVMRAPEGEIVWQDTTLGSTSFSVTELIHDECPGIRIRLYATQTGDCLHCLVVQSDEDFMELNRGFYDQIVGSFAVSRV